MNTLTRRHFLAATTASVAASTVFSGTLLAAETSPFKLGIQLYSLRGFDVDTALRHSKELGFEEIEFYSGMFPTNSSPEQIADMKQKVADLGLTISAHGVNGFSKNHDANRQTFEFAKAIGVPLITADPDPDSFDSLERLVKEFDIRIGIHNHGPGHRYNKAIDVLTAIDGRDERIGACADLGHFIRSGQSATEVIRLLQGRLYGIHLKDFAEMKKDTAGVILGKGHLDVVGVFQALQATGFPNNGAISLEYEENPSDPIEDIRQCVAVAKSAIKKVSAS